MCRQSGEAWGAAQGAAKGAVVAGCIVAAGSSHAAGAQTMARVRRLYEAAGWTLASNWMDPLWLADAEKGRLGAPRRYLYFMAIS